MAADSSVKGENAHHHKLHLKRRMERLRPGCRNLRCTSKVGVHAQPSLSERFAEGGIRVNAVSPGTGYRLSRPNKIYQARGFCLKTIFLLGRLGQPGRSSPQCFFLSKQRLFITAETIQIGGISFRNLIAVSQTPDKVQDSLKK
jgi:NAD(P)-dependent dehydrogenase (short-subunit alcohol dehydrogenase family)